MMKHRKITVKKPAVCAKLRTLSLVLALLLPVFAIAQISVIDDFGNTVTLQGPAKRIISLAPHITETLYAAGAGDNIIATVRYSDYPPAALDIPIIGSYKEVSYESLLSMNPDLVIAWASGNGDEITARIRSLGLTVFLDEPRELEDIASSLRRFGKLTGNEEIAEIEAASFMKKLTVLQQDYNEDEILDVFYQVWNDPLTTLNGDHLISDIIRLCGGRNIFADVIPLAPIVNAESVLTADPQVIVVSGMGNDRPEWLDVWKAWQAKRQRIMVSFTIFQQIYCSAIHRGDLSSSAIVRHTFQGEGNLF